ncbi:MAG: sulfite exporter TauE/SafE family protein [Rhodoplanes sp.]|uniref:TSUP family transporter n=1 Tax=Rhodoplanes sp. TaxID=1968906 RepID=UPI001834F54E|nr:TSUP family transporter [Rhodoplanes sp.]NVO14288.1 sulfite exporter TauE/SafE family protein [Rhodoplanes sp.]
MVARHELRMTLAAYALIAVTIVVSSFISGIFGMAGGMILLGVLLVEYDVATAMVLFSIIQFAANGWRAVMWRKHVRWSIFRSYAVGSLAAFAIMRLIAFIPDKATVYLTLGILPFAIELLPRDARPNIEWRGMPFVAGLLTTVVQFLSGVGGLFLDMFFQKSMIDRKTTVATKAVTQTFSHMLRATYFASFAGAATIEPVWAIPPALLLSIGGTSLAVLVLERMTDHGFRRWTRIIIMAIGVVYLWRGIVLVWGG